MQLAGADADLRTQSELEAVVEPRAGVHQDERGVHLPQETQRPGVVPGDDGLRVVRPVAGDVGQRFVHGVHHLHRQDQVQVLGFPVRFRGRPDLGQVLQGTGAPAQFHTGLCHGARQQGQEVGRDGLVDEHLLQRVAGGRPLGLGVHRDADRHLQVRAFVHVQVVDTPGVRQDGHPRVLLDEADELLPAARDEDVHVAREAAHLHHRLAVCVGDELHRVLRKAGFLQRPTEQRHQGPVAAQGLLPAPQENGVAGLHRQAAGFHSGAGPCLIHHPDDAQGHPHPPHAQAVGPDGQRLDLTHRVWHVGHLPQAFHQVVPDPLVQPQPVQLRPGQPRSCCLLQVRAVGLGHLRPGVHQQLCQPQQRVLFGCGRRRRHSPGCLPGADCHLTDLARDVDHTDPRTACSSASSSLARAKWSRWMTSSECLYPRRDSMSRVCSPLMRSISAAL
ncbi:hypothetical protein HRbin31_00425 [bacterium HR31]|nr:hypothetical protein HRbin31_00425 [bacterium HR31]